MGDQISDGERERVCVWLCVCVRLLPACACVCVEVCVRVCVRVTSSVDNFYVSIACMCPICETGSSWHPSSLVVFF